MNILHALVHTPTADRHATSVSSWHGFLYYFSSPCFIFYTTDVGHPLSSPRSWKIAKHFTHSEHSHFAAQKFTRHESPNYFIRLTRISSYEMGSLYWASIEYYFFCSFFHVRECVCALAYTYTKDTVDIHSPTRVEIIRRFSLAGKSRIRQHTLKITLQIYTIYFRLRPLIPQTNKSHLFDFLVQFYW